MIAPPVKGWHYEVGNKCKSFLLEKQYLPVSAIFNKIMISVLKHANFDGVGHGYANEF